MTESQSTAESDDHFRDQRRELVRELARSGIRDRRVLVALNRVPREQFVPADERRLAYVDRALAIECGQTISQPYTVAFMCQALHFTGTERVLEIGTGSGYNAAVLSRLVAEVYSIERFADLAQSAIERLRNLGCRNVRVTIGDGTLGWPEMAPFDAILVTAAARILPQPYIDQLAEGGRIIIPIGSLSEGQTMCRFRKTHGQLTEQHLGGFQFVPLIGEYGWNEPSH